MAPIRKKRTPMRSRANASQNLPNSTTEPKNATRTSLPTHFNPPTPGMPTKPPTTKHQRQLDRRRALLAPRDRGITKRSQTGTGKKRRRPSKKLLAAEDMDEMRDALPDLSDEGESNEWEGFSDDDAAAQAGAKRRRRRVKAAEGKIQMRTLKSRPGAMKRKRRMEGVEMERFGRNLAQLSANTKLRGENAGGGAGDGAAEGGGGGGGAAASEKWATLRAFIESTMERKDGFQKS